MWTSKPNLALLEVLHSYFTVVNISLRLLLIGGNKLDLCFAIMGDFYADFIYGS